VNEKVKLDDYELGNK